MNRGMLEEYASYSEVWYARMGEREDRRKKNLKWLFKDKLKIELHDNLSIIKSIANYPVVKQLLSQEYGDMTEIEICHAIKTNQLVVRKNTLKTSKLVSKLLAKQNEHVVDEWVASIDKALTKETCYEQLFALQGLEKPQTEVTSLNISEFFAAAKDSRVELSICTTDLMHGSTNSTFSSCLRVGGEYHEGANQYAQSDFTIILRSTNSNNQLIGRRYIFVKDMCIIMGKVYGTLPLEFSHIARRLITKAMADHLNIDDKWKYTNNSSMSCNYIENMSTHATGRCFGYFDAYDLMKIRHIDTDYNVVLEFEDPIDCNGDDWERGYHCSECGDRFNGEPFYCHDSTLCEICYDENTMYCEQCGQRQWLQDSTCVDGFWVCSSCYELDFDECMHCNESFLKNHMTNTDDGYLCDACLDDYYHCPKCDSFYPYEDPCDHGCDDDD